MKNKKSLKKGLKHYWGFDNIQHDKVIDVHGGLNGNFSQPGEATAGKIGKCFDTKIHSALLTEPALMDKAGCSINAWTKFDNNNNIFARWFVKNSNSDEMYNIPPSYINIRMDVMFGNVYYSIKSDAGNVHIFDNLAFTGNFELEEWYMITLTQGDKTAKMYLNGELKHTLVTEGDYVDSAGPFISETNSRDFNFSLDELGVWNRPLNDKEIQALFNAGAGLKYPF